MTEDIAVVGGQVGPTEIEMLRERIANIEASLSVAYRRGRFFIAVFSVENNQIYSEWHTDNFPPDDLVKSCDMLRTDVTSEARAVMEPKALLESTVLAPKPMDMMFGKKKEE